MNISEIVTWSNLTIMLRALLVSLTIALIAAVLGIMIGVVIAFCKLSKNRILKAFGNIYVELLRGTPMLLQILFLFLGFPVIYQLVTGHFLRVNIYVCGTLAMAINSGAYMAELIRSQIINIDKGQSEAAKTLGLNQIQTMRYVVLPQAVRRLIAPFVSELIMLIKDSSLLGTIGVIELLQQARLIGSEHFNYLIPLLIASVYYLVVTVVISYLAGKIEKRLII